MSSQSVHLVHHYWRHNMMWLFVGVLVSCFSAFAVMGTSRWLDSRAADVEQEKMEEFSFTNPLIDCNAYNKLWFDELNPSIADKVRAYIDAVKRNGKARDVSVYFRDINNGYWFGIDEKELFCPASLMKVPMLVAYLKAADTDQTLLQHEYEYTGSLNKYSADTNPTALIVGEDYTVANLLELMILKSDNEATLMLYNRMDKDFLLTVEEDLGFRYAPDADMTDDIISVKRYSSFFRVLYNASYVSKTHSEWGLSLLSRAEFREGIVTGVRSTVPLSHKYGIRNANGEGDLAQFHHAGIIYHPLKPYLLCVMTRGPVARELNAIAGEISNIIFHEIETQTRQSTRRNGRLAIDVDSNDG